MTAWASYVICTAPRSGSTLLCKLLAATGVAGNPGSYFHRPSLEDWAGRLAIAPNAAASEPERLAAIFAAAIAKGRGQTAMFGLRLQRHSFDYLRAKMALLHGDEPTDLALFQRIFGPTLFIHLTRADKIEQAVSYLKAEQTGLWHVDADGAELERVAPHREPHYDGETIKARVATMQAYDDRWNAWFEHQGIEPVRLTYDALSGDPIGTLRQILDCLGLDRTAADGVAPGVGRMADATSQAWIARFRREAGQA